MVKHLAFVEHWWFRCVFLGEEYAEPWASVDWKDDADWDWHSAVDDTPEQLGRSSTRPSSTRSDRRRRRGPRRPLATHRPRRRPVLAALDHHAHGRGVRPPQRPRRPAPRGDRRDHRRVTPDPAIRAATDADWPSIWPFFDATVRAGETYAFPTDLTQDTGRDWWMERPPGLTVVLEEEGRILGSAKMGRTAPAAATTSARPRSWSRRRRAGAASAVGSPSTSCSGTATRASPASSSTPSSRPTPPRWRCGSPSASRSSGRCRARSAQRRTGGSGCT